MSDNGTHQIARFPLALSESGDPIEVPEGAVYWRLKDQTSKKPRLLRTELGEPLQIPIDTTPEEFVELVPARGRYRLEPVTGDGHLAAPDVYAVIVLPDSSPAQDGPTDSRDRLISDIVKSNHELVGKMMQQQQEFMSTIAENFGEYIRGTSKLINAIAPVIGKAAPKKNEPSKDPMAVLREFAEMRNLVDQIAGDRDDNDDDDDSGKSDKRDSAIAALAPVIEQLGPIIGKLIVTKLMGVSEEDAQILQGGAAAPAAQAAPTAKPVPSAADKINADFMAKIAKIQPMLSAEEMAFVLKLLDTMSNQEMTAWRDQVAPMEPKVIVVLIRELMAKAKADAQAVAKEDAPIAAVKVPGDDQGDES